MTHPTIPDAGTYQPDMLRKGVQITGLLRTMHRMLRKIGRTGHNTNVTLVPFAEQPSFFKDPKQDMNAHQQMQLAFLGRHAQQVVDGVAKRLMSHRANATGWFQPRFSLHHGNLQPTIYVPTHYGSAQGIQCTTAVHLRSAGDLGRALALSDLALAHAAEGPNQMHVEKWAGWNTTGVLICAPDPTTALLLAWAWRQPKDLVHALAGGTVEPLKSEVERRYGAQDWLQDRRRTSV